MPRLLVVGADSLLCKRIGAALLGLSCHFLTELPRVYESGDIVFLRFPDFRRNSLTIPRTTAFLGFGEATCLVDAYEAGARDYLKEPWTTSELAYRLARAIPGPVSLSLGDGLFLEGSILIGQCGQTSLSEAAAYVLRQLALSSSGKVSRVALMTQLWPVATTKSRNVDMAISQIRKALSLASGKANFPEIRSVRGFGYRFNRKTACV